MLTLLQQVMLMEAAMGVDAEAVLPKRLEPKQVTQADFDAFEAAKVKRERKAAKRLKCLPSL